MGSEILSQWDGRNTQPLVDFYTENQQVAEFIPKLLPLISQSETQRATTWLLKHFFEQGERLSLEQNEQVYSQLDSLTFWESRLHVLQCIEYMPIPKDYKKPLEFFFRTGLTDSNKFIRAWSYNGYYLLSISFPEYRQEVGQFFTMAMRDEAASVKARIRKILKQPHYHVEIS